MLSVFREAKWLNRRRAAGYAVILFGVMLSVLGWWVAQSDRFISPKGMPIGADFTSFRAAAQLAADGQPAAVYHRDLHYQAQRQLFQGRDVPYFAFYYPPAFLLICLPLAALPYGASLFAWLFTTWLGYWRIVRGLLDKTFSVWPLLAFPAFFLNCMYGQNGFLSTALMGAGALLLDRRQILAGLCFGALIYKPHLGLLIPLALGFAGYWRAFFSAAAMSVVLVLVSWAAFGAETWNAFFQFSTVARTTLESGTVGYEKMQSVFAFFMAQGSDRASAYIAQVIVGVLAAFLLIKLALKRPDGKTLGAALVCATLLATPFLLIYDLTLLAIPLAWTLNMANVRGFRPWEKMFLLWVFFLPITTQANALTGFFIPLAPLTAAVLLWSITREALTQSKAGTTDLASFMNTKSA